MKSGATVAHTVEDDIRDIMVDLLGVEKSEVTPQANIVDDLGADSLDTVELVMSIEERFDLEIPDDAEKFRTFGDVVEYVKQHRVVK